MKTLVFLEHRGDAVVRSALGVLSKAASLGDEVAGVVTGSGVSGLAGEAGAHGDGVVVGALVERAAACVADPGLPLRRELDRCAAPVELLTAHG